MSSPLPPLSRSRPSPATALTAALSLLCGVLSGIAALGASAAPAETDAVGPYDVVLSRGRVIDPETGLDAIRDVGWVDGRIAAVSEAVLEGSQVIDVLGLVVAPGFIDLHTHSPTPLGQHYQLLDGVTTALELEAGAYPVREFAEDIRGKAPIHYGASVGYGSIRVEVKMGIRQPHVIMDTRRLIGALGYWTAFRSIFTDPDEVFVERATPAEREKMRAMLHTGLDSGGLGIGVPLDYFSEAVDREELRMVFEVAGERNVPLFIHVRRGINGDPTGLREALSLAKETGASVHICHITHNAMRNTALFLAEIRAAREDGVDVTTEILPYNAGSALISSAVFGRDWRTIFDIDYEDVEWAATGERFDEDMWHRYREEHPKGQVIHHYVDEAWTRTALVEPDVIVVSDLLPMVTEESKVAPHNGAFSRILGHYVRDEAILDLATALRKMTLLPARRLEVAFPEFERKGRVQVGADADLTIFDASEILDRATYRNPYQSARGIVHVVVDGQFVVRDGERADDVLPGQFLPLEGVLP
jgi:N-acyl-D-aspartate/D-glutamate deacylase